MAKVSHPAALFNVLKEKFMLLSGIEKAAPEMRRLPNLFAKLKNSGRSHRRIKCQVFS
jgi:hypothetical protein